MKGTRYRIITFYKDEWFIQAKLCKSREEAQDYINSNRDIIGSTEQVYIAKEYV